MARPRKSTTRHKLEGTYRRDRHAKNKTTAAQGKPIKPRRMHKYEREMFNLLAPHFEIYEAGRVDSAAIWSACHLWRLYREALDIAFKSPTDRNARAAVVSYLDAWHRIAAKLGATPADRQRLTTSVDATPQLATRKR